MTMEEWMNIGYEKGIIDCENVDSIPFYEAYNRWFCMKKKIIKPQSLDRIEVTWNKYYATDNIVLMPLSRITDVDITKFLTELIIKHGNITEKELARIWQIINNVLVYSHDCDYKGVPLHDWERIRRQLPHNKIVRQEKMEEAVSSCHVYELMQAVVKKRIYSLHQNCSLLLCMNFYLGLRVGELASLTWSDFDFEKGVVKISKTESKFYNRDESGEKRGSMVYRISESTKTIYSIREIPILPEVKYFYDLIKLEHEKRGYESNYLAYDGNDGVYVRALDRTLRTLCTLCGIPHFSTHVIRKTFATRLHFANVPTRVISDLLGHSEIQTTERTYIKNYDDRYVMTLNYMKEGLIYETK